MSKGYLSLTRRAGEALNFSFKAPDGKDIEIDLIVHEINGNQARVAIKAPKDVTILRSELLDNQRKN